MPSYSTAVAIFDFLPVLVNAAALVLIASAISRRHKQLRNVIWLAAVLVPMGGLCKATWKLLVAEQVGDFTWLENLLFILMAPGFVMMAFGVQHCRHAMQSDIAPVQATYPGLRLAVWLSIPIVGGAAAFAWQPDGRLWFFWLLAITTLANATLIVQAILTTRWAELSGWIIACFIYNFAATLALSGLSRLPDTEMTAWIQEGVNLSAQTALAIGFWHLARSIKQSAESTIGPTDSH